MGNDNVVSLAAPAAVSDCQRKVEMSPFLQS